MVVVSDARRSRRLVIALVYHVETGHSIGERDQDPSFPVGNCTFKMGI